MNRKTRVAGALVLTFIIASALTLYSQSATDPLVEFSAKISPTLKQLVALQAANTHKDDPIPVIVQFDRGASAADKQLPPKAKGLPLINGYAHRHSAVEIKALLKSRAVKYITFDAIIRPHQTNVLSLTNVPQTSAVNVNLATIGADQANSSGYTGAGVAVAVLDSGISPHPDLNGRVIGAVDFTSGVPVLSSTNADGYGHGTHVAGILGGSGAMSGGAYSG